MQFASFGVGGYVFMVVVMAVVCMMMAVVVLLMAVVVVMLDGNGVHERWCS